MRYCATSVFVLMSVGLGACGAGGASGGSSGGSSGSFNGGSSNIDVDFTQIATPGSFETTEYFRSGALGQVNASSIYSVGGTGDGQLVAVIDTGIDTDHPQLINQIHPSSTNIVSGNPVEVEDGQYHGTVVSGLIAAERDGTTLHGMAFDAQILAIRADTPGSCATVCTFSQSNLATATDYAVAQGADVINFSLGGALSLTSTYRQALSDAVDAGTILVFAAGNDGDPNPTYPGRFASEAAADGRALVVGAVDGANTIASFSNRAGTSQNAYIVAPGVSLETTFPGGGNAVASGTSMAAPIVSGAVAALLEAAPSLSPQQVVELLLTTATDLGDPGVDAVYGWGLLNLAQAIQPQGTLVIPDGSTVDGGVPVSMSSLSLGGALSGARLGATEVMMLDGYQRPYYRALGDFAVSSDSSFDLVEFMEQRDEDVSRFQSPDGRMSLAALDVYGEERQLRFEKSLDGGFGLMAFVDEKGRLGEVEVDDLIGAGGSNYAFSAFADGGGVSLSRARNGYSFALTAAGGDGGGGEASSALLAASAGAPIDDWLRLDVRAGQLQQDGAVLGTRGEGVFAFENWQSTSFAEINIEAEFGPTRRLVMAAAVGRSEGERAKPEQPLALDDFWSTSWSLAWQERQIWGQDRLTLSVSQPLRAENPSANSYLPVARSLDGKVIRERRKERLEGQGREIDFELAYRRDIDDRNTVGANLMLRHEPGHQAGAEAELVGAATYLLRF